MLGLSKSTEHKRALSRSRKAGFQAGTIIHPRGNLGKRGKVWITDGVINKMMLKIESIPNGFRIGRMPMPLRKPISKETREKMSLAKLGYKVSPEIIIKREKTKRLKRIVNPKYALPGLK